MPKNILSLSPKRTPSLSSSLSKSIRAYISEHYTDTHPEAFTRDLREFCRLRDECSKLETHISSVDVALRYHAQLVFFSTKFPTNIGISFPWTLSFPPSLPLWTSGISGTLEASAENGPLSATSYATNDTVAHPDLNYERANVLFSLASLYSALGASEGRSESESIKRSIAWFQSAAGILQHVSDTIIPEIRHLKPASADLNPNLLNCLRDLMLAQAQECFWQKAVLDRLKNSTISKLAERVSELYASALDATLPSSSSSLGDDSSDFNTSRAHLPSDWETHITVKRWHFAAAAQYRRSCEDLGANRYGDELGRLKVAEGHVKRALESSKRGVSEAIINDLKSLQQIIATNIQRATKDNDLIYLQPVTPASNLPAIVAASMVKPVVPIEVANPIPLLRDSPAPALGKPLFAELVPYGVHLAISIYDDRKDSLVREQIAEKRDELDGIATSTLQSLNLPGSLQALEQPIGLPASLLRKHEEVAAEGGIDRLYSISADIQRIARTDGEILSEAVSMLDQEQLEDEQIRSSFSQHRWPRPPSCEAAVELRTQVDTFGKTLRQAAESDKIVQQKLQDWEDLIGVLSGGMADLEAFVPSLTSSTASAGASRSQSDAQIQAIRSLRAQLENLDDLLDARAACLTEAKSVAATDDIRPHILKEAARLSSSPNHPTIEAHDFEELFDNHLSKYTHFTEELIKSASHQVVLLDRIATLNQTFLDARKQETTSVNRRERVIQNLELAYGKYRELASNLIEGLEFYNGLGKLVGTLREQVKEWCRARKIDINSLTLQFAGTSLSSQQQQSRNKSSIKHDQQELQQRQQQASPPPPPPPQWGAFPGGEIRFGD